MTRGIADLTCNVNGGRKSFRPTVGVQSKQGLHEVDGDVRLAGQLRKNGVQEIGLGGRGLPLLQAVDKGRWSDPAAVMRRRCEEDRGLTTSDPFGDFAGAGAEKARDATRIRPRRVGWQFALQPGDGQGGEDILDGVTLQAGGLGVFDNFASSLLQRAGQPVEVGRSLRAQAGDAVEEAL